MQFNYGKIKEMKLFKLFLLLMAGSFTGCSAAAQNAMINILTKNSGLVKKGNTVFLEISINNTDPASHIAAYKLRPQISVPAGLVSIAATGHVLPTGWTIIRNDGSVITFSNGRDLIGANDSRIILVALKGIKAGGPSIITGQLFFADGNAPGSASGALAGDIPADNNSSTSIQVTK
jgi:hypothetical protein